MRTATIIIYDIISDEIEEITRVRNYDALGLREVELVNDKIRSSHVAFIERGDCIMQLTRISAIENKKFEIRIIQNDTIKKRKEMFECISEYVNEIHSLTN